MRILAILFLISAAVHAAEIMPQLEVGAVIELERRGSGHIQGIATDGRHIYWSITRTLFKSDWNGKVLAECKGRTHFGGPCWAFSKLYVPVCGSGFNKRLTVAESKNFVHVYDENLKLEKVYELPEQIFGIGGMAFHDGRFFVVGGRPKGMPGNTVYEYDAEFHLLKKHELNFNSSKGIQTITRAWGRWYLGCYGLSGNASIELDDDFRLLRRVRPRTAFGALPLNEPGKLLVAFSQKEAGKKATVTTARVCEVCEASQGKRGKKY